MNVALPPAPDLAGYLGELRTIVEQALTRLTPRDKIGRAHV